MAKKELTEKQRTFYPYFTLTFLLKLRMSITND